MVLVVTVLPSAHRFEPREMNVVVAPGAVSMPYRSASAASRLLRESAAAAVGGSVR
jgi:hypothetical protein